MSIILRGLRAFWSADKINAYNFLLKGSGLIKALSKIADFLLKIIYPEKCIFCGEINTFDGKVKICFECAELFISEHDTFCEMCGRQLDKSDLPEEYPVLCAYCKKHRFHFDRALALWSYKAPNSRAVLNLKFNRNLENTETLGILCANDIKRKLSYQDIDIIVPVPLHKSKMKSRGFNQSELIAKVIGRHLSIRVNGELLKRVKKTNPQMSLSAKERAENISGAIAAQDKTLILGKSVLLIDDIFTTGSTINECAKVLKECGARSVFCYCVCITEIKYKT